MDKAAVVWVLLLGSLLPTSGQQPNLTRQVVTVPGPAGATAVPAAETPPENLCVLEGKIVNATTGEPLRKAAVTLRRMDVTQSLALAGVPLSYVTTSDASGQYRLKELEPGKYRVYVTRNGFTRTEYGSRGPMRAGTTLSLEQGQKMTGVDFKLIPHGVVSGRVVDEDGEPLLSAQVSVMRWTYSQGTRQLRPMNSASTNDLGEFRIYGIAPGRYYLSASFTNRMFDPNSADRSNESSDEGYVPTFFPGTTDAAGAATIDVAVGQHLGGIELRLSKTKTLRVRGRVVNQTGLANRPVMLELVPRDRGLWGYYAMNRQTIGAQGKFEFRGLAPGSYTLMARVFDGRNAFMARMPVDLTGDNLDSIVLTVAPGVDVHGEVRLEGAEAGTVDLKALTVGLSPDEFMGSMAFAPEGVQSNGSLLFKNVSAERYRVYVSGQPEGYYIKSVRMGDQDGLDNGLDLTAGPSGPVRITLAPGAAQVDGNVLNDKKEPLSGATVVLRPEKEALRRRPQSVRTATTDQHGRYTFRNLDPADYRLFAWEDVENGAWMDPDFMRPFESKGKKIELKEGSRETVELAAIPVE